MDKKYIVLQYLLNTSKIGMHRRFDVRDLDKIEDVDAYTITECLAQLEREKVLYCDRIGDRGDLYVKLFPKARTYIQAEKHKKRELCIGAGICVFIMIILAIIVVCIARTQVL